MRSMRAGRRQLRGALDLSSIVPSVRYDAVADTVGTVAIRFEVALALEPLLHDLHVEEPQEPAAEAEAERGGRLGLVVAGRSR